MAIDRRTVGLGLASALLLLAGSAKAASDEDLARLILDGRLDDALSAADRALAQDRDSSAIRLMAGALRFAKGDYSGAGRFFDSGGPVGGYLLGGPLDVNVLRTHIPASRWRYLASVRANDSEIDPGQLKGILLGDVELYAEQQAALERALHDGLVLSVASSPGRTQFLDGIETRARAQHRCTAHFVRAEFAIAANEATDARASLDAAVATPQPELLEYHVARAERARLG
jgi:hypothetical protein